MNLPLKIARSSRRCAECEKEFRAADRYTSFVCTEIEEWKRVDVGLGACELCTPEKQGQLKSVPKEPLAQWTCEVATKKKGLVLSEDAVWQVLKKASTDTVLAARPATFFLCLLLSRKRRLREIKQYKAKSGQEMQVYANKSRAIEITVPVPILSPAALGRLKREMEDFFSSES